MTEEQRTCRKGKRLVACRECQRLKLKCNRSWPCDSCIKRGVEDICPEGVLPTTKRQRINLIDTSRLYENNIRMSTRIRELESALATVQNAVSSDPHPLLRQDLLAVGTPAALPTEIEGIKPNVSARSSPTPVEETLDEFGTLSTGVHGRTVFHSHAVSADYLIEPWRSETAKDRLLAEAMTLTPEIINLATLFPFGDTLMTSDMSDLKQHILSFLPPVEKAALLVHNFYEYFSWWLDPVPRDQFDRDIFPILDAPPEMVFPDRLSVFFMILAIGTYFDIENPVDFQTADSYWQLSRAAFCLEPVLDVSTTYAIQALLLMTDYLHKSKRQKVEYQWALLGLIARMIHSSGLHYDPENWFKNIDDEGLIQQRRRIFYEVMAYDGLMSFNIGRPPAFSLAHIQAKLPVDKEKFMKLNGMEESGLSILRYRFTRECLYPIMEEAFGAKPPTHTTILRLDRKLREFPIPSHLLYPNIGGQTEELGSDQVSLHLWMQRTYLFGLREKCLLFLHRSHFAFALLEHPSNPFEGRYAASVLATYRSASRITAQVRDISRRYTSLVSRHWWIWQNLFAAALSLGTLILRSPKCKLADAAMQELTVANELFHNSVTASQSEHPRRIINKYFRACLTAIETGQSIPAAMGTSIFDQNERGFDIHTPRMVLQSDYLGVGQPGVGAYTADRDAQWAQAHPDLARLYVHAGPHGNPYGGSRPGSSSGSTSDLHLKQHTYRTDSQHPLSNSHPISDSYPLSFSNPHAHHHHISTHGLDHNTITQIPSGSGKGWDDFLRHFAS